MIKIAVIGAGMTGITISNLLRKKVRLSIFEKSRGLGGRMATRRSEPYQFNHGTQYFKIKSKEFNDFLSPLIRKKIIQHWKGNHIEVHKNIITKTINTNHNKYFIGVPHMNSIVKYFANNNFSIKLSCKIEKIEKISNEWYIYDSDNVSYGPYDWIVFTVPPKQAANLLYKNFRYQEIINNIKMKSCFSIMLGFEEFKKLNFDTALFINEDVQWLSFNKICKHNKEYYNLLINSSYSYTEKNINSCHDKVSNYLLKKVSDFLNYELNNYNHKAVHFWRYAVSENNNNFGSFIDDNSKIIVCGDWCMNGKVEGAFLSAKDAVIKILNYI